MNGGVVPLSARRISEFKITFQYDSVVQYQMVDIVASLVGGASKEAVKLLTGKLLTESQIQSISKHVVGRYFADLLPTLENEAEGRIASARRHITEASNTISSLQGDFEKQAD